MPQHIGIVACSAEGAALCYRTICVEGAALFGAHAHPEVSMHTPSLADYMAHIYRDDWPRVGELMLASADKLEKAGADFLICPDNTIHQALPYVLPRSPLPWLHIAEVVAAEAVAARLPPHRRDRHALAGRQRGLPGEACGARPGVSPPERRRARRDAIASSWTSWSAAPSRPQSVAYFQQVIGRLKDGGCDAVVLGCTEIPLIINDANSPLPTLDSTRLLARAALKRAAKKGLGRLAQFRPDRQAAGRSRPGGPRFTRCTLPRSAGCSPPPRRRRPSRARRTPAPCALPRGCRRSRACCAPAASRA